jgi:AcrR family transcriptional regulator
MRSSTPAARLPRRDAPKRVSRDVWLDRAADHLLNNGVGSFSMRSFATKRGVSTQALIGHFGSRENLIREALKRTFERDQLAAEELVRRMSSVRQLFEELVGELQKPQFFRRNAMQLELFAIAALEPEKHSDFAGRITRRVHGILESQVRREGIAEESVARVTGFLVAASRGLILEALGGQSPQELRMIADQVLAWYEAQLPRR